MKSLFLYYLKKRIPLTLIMSFLTLVVFVVITATTRMGLENRYNPEINQVYILGLGIVPCIFGTIIPIYEFSFKMRRNSVDLFYSLPIKRYKLYLTKYLIGLFELFVIFSISYLYVVLFDLITAKTTGNAIYPIYFIPAYFVLLGVSVLLFTWFSFAYTRGNTVLDGILYVIISIFIFTLMYNSMVMTLQRFNVDGNYGYLRGYDYIPYHLVIGFANYFEGKVLFKSLTTITHVISLYGLGGISVAFGVLFFVLNVTKKAEDTSDVSKEWYTYKLLLPIYLIGLYIIIPYHLFYAVLIAIAGYIGYVIFNRSFKIKVCDLIMLCVCIIGGTALSVILSMI